MEVRVEVEQEHLDHYSMQGGSRIVNRELVNERRIAILSVNVVEAAELMRLIRED